MVMGTAMLGLLNEAYSIIVCGAIGNLRTMVSGPGDLTIPKLLESAERAPSTIDRRLVAWG